ncbi:MAG: 50S ribosomal protein L4, partial [Candidatus Limnocylindria bacterium]
LPTAPAGQAALIGADGAVSGSVALPGPLTSTKRRAGVLFQAFVAQAANARQATATTKNRAQVAGGGSKPWRQKGTGRSRQGSIRSPLWRHGGVAFGPNGRAYGQRMPEKMRKAAFAEAFAARAAEGRVLVFEELAANGDRPRTRSFAEWLGRIGDTGSTVVVTAQPDETVVRVARNLPQVTLRSVETLRLADLLSHDTLLVRRDALEALGRRGTVEAVTS